jgi:hypothetical protein
MPQTLDQGAAAPRGRQTDGPNGQVIVIGTFLSYFFPMRRLPRFGLDQGEAPQLLALETAAREGSGLGPPQQKWLQFE